MAREDVMNLVHALRNSFDNAETRDDILTQISDEISTLFDNNETLSNSNSEYVRNNEALRAANMKLFLQMGSAPTPEAAPEPQVPPEPTKKNFSDLFDENGGLK